MLAWFLGSLCLAAVLLCFDSCRLPASYDCDDDRPSGFLLLYGDQIRGGLKTQAAPCEPTELGFNPFYAELEMGTG